MTLLSLVRRLGIDANDVLVRGRSTTMTDGQASEADGHDWHIYDEANGYEVSQSGDQFVRDVVSIRHKDNHERVIEIDGGVWDKVRTGELDETELFQ